MIPEPNANYAYSLFSELYYEHIFDVSSNNKIHVSEVNLCLLKSFFQRKLKRTMMNPKVVILSFGRIVHKALQKYLEKRGYKTEVENDFNFGNVTLTTHTDAVHEDHIIEIKTITMTVHNILSHHYLQANSYAIINNKPKGWVWYVQKPSGIIKSYPFKPYAESFKLVLLRATRLSHCLNTNVTPQPEPSWLCRVCEYFDICPKPLKYLSRKGGT